MLAHDAHINKDLSITVGKTGARARAHARTHAHAHTHTHTHKHTHTLYRLIGVKDNV